jgi:hypothetical protein
LRSSRSPPPRSFSRRPRPRLTRHERSATSCGPAPYVAQPGEHKHGYDKRGLALLLEQGADGADRLVTRDLRDSSQGHDAIP